MRNLPKAMFSQNDPDWLEDENPISVSELVEVFLTFDAKRLSDYLEETELLSDEVCRILYDDQNDKIGRIKDMYDFKIQMLARWVEENYETNNYAKMIYNDTMEDIA